MCLIELLSLQNLQSINNACRHYLMHYCDMQDSYVCYLLGVFKKLLSLPLPQHSFCLYFLTFAALRDTAAFLIQGKVTLSGFPWQNTQLVNTLPPCFPLSQLVPESWMLAYVRLYVEWKHHLSYENGWAKWLVARPKSCHKRRSHAPPIPSSTVYFHAGISGLRGPLYTDTIICSECAKWQCLFQAVAHLYFMTKL